MVGSFRAGRITPIPAAMVASVGGVVAISTGGPTPTAPVSSSSFPDSTNTGVPAGTSLTTFTGAYHTSANNEVVDAMLVTGTIVVDHTGVLIKRCKITAQAPGDSYSILINATGCTVQDCELDGGVTGITGISLRNGVQCYRLDIHGCENGADVDTSPSGTPALIQDSWIHDLSPEGSGFHTDGIQFAANASYLTIEHCHFQPIPSGVRNATSCINLDNEVTGTNNHITINNNLIDGRGCGSALYVPRFSGWSAIVVTNNRMRSGDNGYTDGGNSSTWPGGGVTTFTGNVDDATSAALTVDQ